jgi:hypothetical protein
MARVNSEKRVERRFGGRYGVMALVCTAVAIITVILVGLLVVSERRASKEPDSLEVVWSRWAKGQPNTFEIRVRVYRSDRGPILGSVIAPEPIDLQTNARPNLHQGLMWLDKWDVKRPDNSAEVTLRGRLASAPDSPVQFGFQLREVRPPPPSALETLLRLPPSPRRRKPQWLLGSPAILQPPKRKSRRHRVSAFRRPVNSGAPLRTQHPSGNAGRLVRILIV